MNKIEELQAARLLMAHVTQQPPDVFEQIRLEHWQDSHGGTHGGDCQFCGFCDAAVYEAKTGRSLAKDMFGYEATGKAQGLPTKETR